MKRLTNKLQCRLHGGDNPNRDLPVLCAANILCACTIKIYLNAGYGCTTGLLPSSDIFLPCPLRYPLCPLTLSFLPSSILGEQYMFWV